MVGLSVMVGFAILLNAYNVVGEPMIGAFFIFPILAGTGCAMLLATGKNEDTRKIVQFISYAFAFFGVTGLGGIVLDTIHIFAASNQFTLWFIMIVGGVVSMVLGGIHRMTVNVSNED